MLLWTTEKVGFGIWVLEFTKQTKELNFFFFWFDLIWWEEDEMRLDEGILKKMGKWGLLVFKEKRKRRGRI